MERPASPDTFDTVRALITQFEEELHTAFPAKVQSYDATKQTADLVPLVKQPVLQPDGSSVLEDLPVLPSVPVLWPRAGKAFVSMPLAAGDTVLVLCCESATGSFRVSDGSSPQPPGDLRRFNLSHAVAIPGLFPRSKALTHASATDIVIGFDDGARVSIKTDGSVHLATDTGTALAMASAVNDRLTKLQAAFDAHVHLAAGTPTAVPTTVPGVIPVGTLADVGATKVNGV